MGVLNRTKNINPFQIINKNKNWNEIYYFFPKIINNGILIDKTFLENEKCSYNGAIIIKKNNRFTNIIDNLSDSEIINFFRLTLYDDPLSEPSIHIKMIDTHGHSIYLKKLEGRYEDGRIFVFKDQLFLTVCQLTFIQDKIFLKMRLLWLDNNYDIVNKTLLEDIGNNSSLVMDNEKNWLFFEYDDKVWIIYSVCPFIIYTLSFDEEIREIIKIEKKIHQEWDWFLSENIRGGTCPIFVDDNFYMFTHSKLDYNKYAMIIIVFNSDFKIQKRSDLLYFAGYGIIFPIGCIYVKEEQRFYITCGIEDREQYILQFTKLEIDSLLKDI